MKSIGMLDEDISFVLEKYNPLLNLQLLEGPINEEKLAMDLDRWVDLQPDSESVKTKNYIPDCSLELKKFKSFYDQRSQILKRELIKVLST